MGIDFRYLEFTEDYAGNDFRGKRPLQRLCGDKILWLQFFPRLCFVVLRLFTSKNDRNSRWSREDVIHKTLYQTEALIFAVHQLLKNFAETNFYDSIFLRVRKEFDFAILAKTRENC